MSIRSEHLNDADKVDLDVVGFLNATEEVRRLEKALADARASADKFAAAMDTQSGEARGRLGRLAAHLGVKEQSLKNQRQRAKHHQAQPDA
ncbi:hypothetical protein [Streptantibioticus ferralitis]|uniref:Uncharacterized protein n=1 Tax=Streptantibioticus ferralitis TaxID=236510 RepID=A0ABT5Z781_9ACTN|nr:hypothetical protein [Streptantibioticus ferralitis]MDF2259668.1 hypothetical protein [Streptantibioticus ferralitis]